jgi:hypothetical protein
MRPAIEKIAHIDIPDAALKHDNVKQVTDFLISRTELDDLDRVIGTQNTKKPELYGWVGDIDWHVDNQGDVYFVILSNNSGVLFAENESPIQYSQGDVIRMNDFTRHKVEQSGEAVGLFIGAFECGDDMLAIDALKTALDSLTERSIESYGRAPRWEGGPLHDYECYVWHFDEELDLERTLHANALGTQGMILMCSHGGCSKHASQIDHHFPYMDDNNLCATHAL